MSTLKYTIYGWNGHGHFTIQLLFTAVVCILTKRIFLLFLLAKFYSHQAFCHFKMLFQKLKKRDKKGKRVGEREEGEKEGNTIMLLNLDLQITMNLLTTNLKLNVNFLKMNNKNKMWTCYLLLYFKPSRDWLMVRTPSTHVVT